MTDWHDETTIFTIWKKFPCLIPESRHAYMDDQSYSSATRKNGLVRHTVTAYLLLYLI